MWPCQKTLPQVSAGQSDQQSAGKKWDRTGGEVGAGLAKLWETQTREHLRGLGKPHYASSGPQGLQGLTGAQAVQGHSPCGFASACLTPLGSDGCPVAPGGSPGITVRPQRGRGQDPRILARSPERETSRPLAAASPGRAAALCCSVCCPHSTLTLCPGLCCPLRCSSLFRHCCGEHPGCAHRGLLWAHHVQHRQRQREECFPHPAQFRYSTKTTWGSSKGEPTCALPMPLSCHEAQSPPRSTGTRSTPLYQQVK